MSRIQLRKGPHGVKVAAIDPPNELVGSFLTVEGDGTDSWACTEVAEKARAALEGPTPAYSKTGNTHSVRIEPQGVTIKSIYDEPMSQITISAEDYLSYVDEWVGLLSAT